MRHENGNEINADVARLLANVKRFYTKKEYLIIRQKGHFLGDSIIWKEYGKFYVKDHYTIQN